MEKKLTVEMQRFSVTSSKPFEQVLAAFDTAVGHPDLGEFHRKLGSTKTYVTVPITHSARSSAPIAARR